MLFRVVDDLHAGVDDPFVQLVHAFRRTHDKPQMVEDLPMTLLINRQGLLWNLMQGQVIDSRTHIHVPGIGFPDDRHPEPGLIKRFRDFQIRHVQGYVA